MIDFFLNWAASWSLLEACVFSLAENMAIFALVLVLGDWAVHRWQSRPVSPPPAPLTYAEVVWALLCVILNSAVTVAGWILWQAGIIVVRRDIGLAAFLDTFILLIAMDFAMYFLHRLAHARRLYSLLHRLHHHYDNPRPLTLFVLNPLEVLAFGTLWLVVLCLYHASFLGIGLYLTLNLVFGTLGHLGVEPFGPWDDIPFIRHLGGSAFHARHHHDGAVNFGFYTTIWDRLFGTLGKR